MQMLQQKLARDPAFATCTLTKVAQDRLVIRGVPAKQALVWLDAARAHGGRRYAAICTDPELFACDEGNARSLSRLSSISLADARAERRAELLEDDQRARKWRSLATATPQRVAWRERDTWIGHPDQGDAATVAIIMSPRPLEELATLLVVGGDEDERSGTHPSGPVLAAWLRHLAAEVGADPVWSGGWKSTTELRIARPPRTLTALRRCATDVYLLSQGNFEGTGNEPPRRILRRLQEDRWVLWWYGEHGNISKPSWREARDGGRGRVIRS